MLCADRDAPARAPDGAERPRLLRHALRTFLFYGSMVTLQLQLAAGKPLEHKDRNACS